MKRIFYPVLAVTAALFMVCGLVTTVSVKTEDDSFHAITTSLSVNAPQDTAKAARYYPASIRAKFHEGDKVLKTVTLSAANNWTAAQSTIGMIRISSYALKGTMKSRMVHSICILTLRIATV